MAKRIDLREPIAIVGIGCRFPGGIDSPETFWSFLSNRGNAIREVPADRWDAAALFHADPSAPGRTYARRGGFLDGIDQFDPQFFGISPREAAHVDPQQRLLLETAHEAMEDAGERWDDARVRDTGVFVGVFIHDYQHMQFADRELLSAHTGTGTAMSIAANRVSYVFDLHGPSMAVDTACSSSLVAVDLACKAIRNGECTYALAGGVNVILKPEMTIAMSKATMLSKEGTCKSFDARADGYVRGEGAGMVLLRPLSDALADGNPIYAVIRGSGVNSDGQTKGISVPNGEAQEALSRRVLQEAGLPPSSIDYVEAHGTGTPVGDPIEAGALGRSFSSGRGAEDPPVMIGSVKTNIGHLESASGVAGLIKTALCLRHRELQPNLHFEQPNPAIDFAGMRLQVVTEKQPWPSPRESRPRRAAVNSFGFGGTNAHVILEEAPALAAAPAGQPARTSAASGSASPLIMPMGAHDDAALRALAGQYADVLADGNDATDLLYTVSQRRTQGACRAALIAKDIAELRAQLRALCAAEQVPAAVMGQRLEGFSGRPVCVFSGMGPQWWAMGRELIEQDPLFRAEIERVDACFRAHTEVSVLAELLADEAASRMQQTHIAQPGIFAIQVALFAFWKARGVEPAAIMGHSVGEAAALYAAGVLTLEQAATVIFHRSRLQHTTAGTGTMLAVGVDVARAEQLLVGREDRVAIGAINAPASLTLSGDADTLEEIRQRLDAEGTFARWLKVEVPYHSPQMEPIKHELLRSLAAIEPSSPSCHYYSTIDGAALRSPLGGAEYWWRNVRQSVLFAGAMDAALQDGHVCFLEIGPHPVLRAAMQECIQKRNVVAKVVSSLRRGQPERESLAVSLGELHTAGARIAWERIIPRGQVVRLPPYPWQRGSHWSESEHAEQYRKGLTVTSGLRASQQRHALLGGKLDLSAPTWLTTLRLSEHAYLIDHKVQGNAVFPGTGYLEMALQTLAAQDAEHGAEPTADDYLLLSDVEIGRALYLTPDDEACLQTTRSGDRWSISGTNPDADAVWVRHASGRCRREKRGTPAPPLDLAAVRERCALSLPADYAYRLFRDVGLEYGPTFQAIEELWYGPREALARLNLPSGLDGVARDNRSGFLFHPALLDACLHTLFGALNLNGEDADRRGNVFLPVSVRQLRIYGRPTEQLYSHARLHTCASQHFEADVRVYDAQHQLVAEVLDLRCQALEHPTSVAQQRRREWMFEYVWDALPLPSAGPRDQASGGRWLLFVPQLDHPLVSLLSRRGERCICVEPGSRFGRGAAGYTLPPSEPGAVAALLDEVHAAGGLDGIIHAWATGASDPDAASWSEQERGAGSLLHLVQALGARQERAADVASDLWVVTSNTQAVVEGQPIALPHSTLWGLRRVIANEHPSLQARIVDVDGTGASWASLAQELPQPPKDDELAYRDGARFASRLRRYQPDEPSAGQPVVESSHTPRIELKVLNPGDLQSMCWVPLPNMALADHEVEVEVAATALNFKDVMKATGLFPPRLVEGNLWSKDTLGMECAGRVSRVGRGVRGVRVGDEVMALAPRSYASHVLTHELLVVPNPGLPAEQAAAIPVAFLTAVVGLEQMAGLQSGERVLIHAATGGVGRAAIQVARSLGAEIFATAGSEAKRQLLRDLGIQHVFDSRSLRFAEDIRAATGGEGVDVVLNSLAGDAIAESLAVLRDYGRFVEIGKMDLDKDMPLGLRPFTRCLSFHAVDLDRMLAQKVGLCGRLLRSIYERFADGRFEPLPSTSYRTADVANAFYEMAGARHTGKLVVEVAPRSVPIRRHAGVAFRADASYVITGGLGGFGLELAAWLAEHGAGHLVLLGRRGRETPGAQRAVARLQALGASVQIEACDVGQAEHVRAALGAIPPQYPLRGVFHAAAVLDDALLKNLDLERYRRTFGPKVLGAWYLHEQTRGLSLDHFMCFSSMASVLGNQGSGNYCAANAFVDSLAHHRRQQGLPALTVNWGVIADVGMAADEDFYRQNLERNGLQTIHSRHCLELLGLLLEQGRVQTTVCPIDFEIWLGLNPAGREARLQELLAASVAHAVNTRSQAAEEVALRAELEALEAPARATHAQLTVRNVMANVFRIDAEKIDATRSLTALGADSLMAIEIKNRLQSLGLPISVTQLLNRNSVSTVADLLLQELGYLDAAAAGPAPSPEPEALSSASWFTCNRPRPDAKLRLVCFPYAGGGSAVYGRWSDALPDWIEVVAVNLPGRGVRTDDGMLPGIAGAADAMLPELLPLLDRPFALFGHCMGAILMYEVAQRLQQQGTRPVHVFASGCMAPHLYNSPLVHEQDDAMFLDVLRLISFSGTRALIEDPELRRTTFPMLRGDFRAVVEYGDTFRPAAPLEAPITGLAADNDLFAAPKAMHAWGGYTAHGYALAQLPGDHYFVESDRETVTQIVASQLAKSLQLPAALSPVAPAVRWHHPQDKELGLPPQPTPLHRAPRRPSETDAPVQVLCFPATGILAHELSLPASDAELSYRALEWRGPTGTPAPRSVEAMVQYAYDAIGGDLDRPTIFFGQCLGSIVAYELALRLQQEGRHIPEHLLVAGAVGPHLYVAPDAQNLPPSKLIELLGVLKYPFAARLRDEPEFVAARLDGIRADLEAMATYKYSKRELLAVPVTAICLRHDLWSYPLRTGSWKQHTQERCEVVEWEGDHYHALQHPERVHELVRSFLANAIAAE